MDDLNRLPWPEVHDIQERLGKHVGVSKGAPDEYRWYLYTPRRDPYTVEGIEQPVYVVDEFDDLDYSDFTGPRWIVFRIGERYFRVTGRNQSHVGEDWSLAHLAEVQGTKVKKIKWTSHWDES